MEIGFDIIGDLYLSPDDDFNWDGKATSLYCIVTGNVGNDMGTLYKNLDKIAENYKGVFYVSGSYEFEDCDNLDQRVSDINYVCQQLPNVASLWHHVVILENIAILGCNGWMNEEKFVNHIDQHSVSRLRLDDVVYLKNSVKKLQKHGDVKSIIVASNSVPSSKLYFGEGPTNHTKFINLDVCLSSDTENKVKVWTYGSYGKPVDYTSENIQYISNPYKGIRPYWPKRIQMYT